MPNVIRGSVPVTCALAAFCHGALGANMIVNGDFSGGKTGFTSSYDYKPGAGQGLSATSYTIDTDPKAWNPNYATFGDHTSGTGQMLIANGSERTAYTSNDVWQETIAVQHDTVYSISFWGASAFDSNKAQLSIYVNGTELDNWTLLLDVGKWEQFEAFYNSGTDDFADVRIVDRRGTAGGNDFCIDDIYMDASPAPAPGSAALVGAAGLLGLRRRR